MKKDRLEVPTGLLALLAHSITIEIQRGENQNNPDQPLLCGIIRIRTAIVIRAARHSSTSFPLGSFHFMRKKRVRRMSLKIGADVRVFRRFG